eukprot:7173186-Pyramimonas_sp.AAC.1
MQLRGCIGQVSDADWLPPGLAKYSAPSDPYRQTQRWEWTAISKPRLHQGPSKGGAALVISPGCQPPLVASV